MHFRHRLGGGGGGGYFILLFFSKIFFLSFFRVSVLIIG
jgi:hypothetical protein